MPTRRTCSPPRRWARRFRDLLDPTRAGPGDQEPVHVIVGFPAGGGTDMIARILAERLRGPYASTVLVENAGAAARLAVEYVKNAEPDGSVMLFTPDFPITVYPHSFRSLNYDPLRDHLGRAGGEVDADHNVGPAVPDGVKSLADFVQWCKAIPQRRRTAPPRPAARRISSA